MNFPKFERPKKIRKQPLSTPIFPADRAASAKRARLDGHSNRIRILATI